MRDFIYFHGAELRFCARIFLFAALALVALDLVGHAFLVACGKVGPDSWPALTQMAFHMGRWSR